MSIPANPKAPKTAVQRALSDLQCVPVNDRSLLEAVKAAHIVLYLAAGADADHPVLQDFRGLIIRLNPWTAESSLDDATACAELAAGRRSILTRLGLSIWAGSTLTLHRDKPCRVLVVFYASPLASSVTVSLGEASELASMH